MIQAAMLWLLFLGLISGQLISVHISPQTASTVLLLDIALVVYSAIGVLRCVFAHKPLPVSLPAVFLIGFLLWLPITLLVNLPLLSPSEIVLAVAYQVRFVLLAGTFLVTVWFWKHEQRASVLRMLLAAGMTLVFLGFLQLALLPDLHELSRKYGWDPHVGRMVGTFLDPNYFGMFLVMLAAALLGAWVYAPTRQGKLTLGSLCVITVVALLTTFSRSAYLALAVAAVIILVIKSPRQMVSVMLVSLLLVGVVPRARERVIGALTIDTTARMRIETWSETLKIIQTAPLLGVGYNAYGPAVVRAGIRQDLSSRAAQGSDSSFLFVLATTGPVGLVFFLFFYLALLAEMLILWRRRAPGYHKGVSLAMIGIIPAYLIHSQFVNSLFYPHLFVPFAVLAGVIVAAGESQSDGRLITPPVPQTGRTKAG